jgi:hypothetical protein
MVQEIQSQNGFKIMNKKELAKLAEAEKELARLKLRLEIIRTICPILAIALQIIILVRVF